MNLQERREEVKKEALKGVEIRKSNLKPRTQRIIYWILKLLGRTINRRME